MKNKGLKITLLVILVCVLIGTGIYLILKKGNETKEETKTEVITEKYVAYIKINPSIKLEYSRECTKYKDKIECNDPVVDNYELVNDDAKEIFKDVNLTSESKKLVDVVETIFQKVKEAGIEIKDVEIKSNWNNLENYLSTTESTSTKENKVDEKQVDVSEIIKEETKVQVEAKEQINTNIQNEVIEEEKIKEETAKKEAEEKARKEAEAKAKAEAEKKAREAQTINLSENVTYCHSMITYECDNCFSNNLITTLKNAKGHQVVSSNSNSITIKRITSLSGSYNSTTFFGTGYLSKITDAGGEEVGGAGGCEDLLTKDECSSYNLICK